jgi:TPR repeat protein
LAGSLAQSGAASPPIRATRLHEDDVGLLDEPGSELIQDYAQAMARGKKGADQNSPPRNIGRLFEAGDAVGKDVAKAKAWYQKAGDQREKPPASRKT